MKEIWNELRDRVHENAVKHGFWEGTDMGFCPPEKLVLIHSEVSEALEADRNDRHLANEYVLSDFWREYQLHLEIEKIEKETPVENVNFKDAFEEHIKDTFEDELADVVIRCLDLCGKKGIDVDELISKVAFNEYFNSSIPEMLCCLHTVISDCFDGTNENYYLNIVKIIPATIQIADITGTDLLKHIELKMKYNELRPYKHGKKY